MAHFIDPDDFSSDDELLDHIIENVVVPSLTEQMSAADMEHIQGVAYVFGGRQDLDPEMISHLYRLVEREGMSLEYALRELTTLQVGKIRHASRGGLQVHYIELTPDDDDVEDLCAEELQAMFDYED